MSGVEFKGDNRALLVLVEQTGQLASPAARRELSEQLGAAALHRVGSEFEQGVDPYGGTWAALRSRAGSPLRDTGRLANSFHFTASGDGFRLDTEVKYAAVHQYGATITAKTTKGLRFRVGGARPRTSGQWVRKQSVTIPRRQMVPEVELGPVWSADFDAETTAFLEGIFGR